MSKKTRIRSSRNKPTSSRRLAELRDLCERDTMTLEHYRKFTDGEREADDRFTQLTRHHLHCRKCGQSLEDTIESAASVGWVVKYRDRTIVGAWCPRCSHRLREHLQSEYEDHIEKDN